MWMGVSTLHTSNIKGKTFEFAHMSCPASCVDWALRNKGAYQHPAALHHVITSWMSWDWKLVGRRVSCPWQCHSALPAEAAWPKMLQITFRLICGCKNISINNNKAATNWPNKLGKNHFKKLVTISKQINTISKHNVESMQNQVAYKMRKFFDLQ